MMSGVMTETYAHIKQMAQDSNMRRLGRFQLALLGALTPEEIAQLAEDEAIRVELYGDLFDTWLSRSRRPTREQIKALLRGQEGAFIEAVRQYYAADPDWARLRLEGLFRENARDLARV
jgi:predicted ATPase